ncbi:MAG TPA: NusA-like transcription termination signal-binding factor [Methanomicrobia archaeon]|nr:MAG: NusA-like transcription termination signal-binding factor [Thermococci archaeon]RLF98348.1 MAG: NusA-like transcription termination signal-binding factor [Thermococci archaeon]HDN82059.1 NusA-like transcription termination signal-binding factor [Methanomicrobia archaeon]
MGLKLGTEEIKCIGLFESMTGAKVVDCILEDDKLIFVVIGRDVGLAIGKKGMNIKKMSEMSGKKIEVIEYSDVPEQFIKNILRPVKVKSVLISERNNKKIATIGIAKEDKGLVIGKSGKNIKRIRSLLNRHHDITDVLIM